MDRIIIQLPFRLKVGIYDMRINYKGYINDRMEGVYYSVFNTQDSNSDRLVTTQFQATAARQAFPCWDEPYYKARFYLSLMVPKSLTAISNMPVQNERKLDNKLKLISFMPTPKMSTYLVAFVIGNLDQIRITDRYGKLHSVYTIKDKDANVHFALNVSVRTLNFYIQYFQVNYPLPKIDLVAIPDFAYGAMENWGLITFREEYLLADEHNTTQEMLQSIALIISHEIAHQWFGNLVTMQWWTDIWLNEGFATWAQYFCVDYLFPEFDIWTQFTVQCMKPAMEADMLPSSHPIEAEIKSTVNILELFDIISYCKGGSLIRMLIGIVGPSVFQLKLQNYLRKYQYNVTSTSDMWSMFKDVNKTESIATMMSTWTKQPGFPVIFVDQILLDNATKLCFYQYRLTYSSQKFLDRSLWMISILISDSNGNKETKILSRRSGSKIIKGKSNWIKINAGKVGFFVVSYSHDMMINIVNNLHRLDSVDRFDIQADTFLMCLPGLRTFSQYLELLKSYEHEDNLIIWQDIILNIKRIRQIVSNMNDKTMIYLLNTIVANLLTNIVTKCDILEMNETYEDYRQNKSAGERRSEIQALILIEAGISGDSRTEKHIRNVVDDIFTGKNISLDQDQFKVVASIASYHNFAYIADYLMNISRQRVSKYSRRSIYAAMGFIREPVMLWKLLDFNFFSGYVRHQDVSFLVQRAGETVEGRTIMLKYFSKNYLKLLKVLGIPLFLDKVIKRAFIHLSSHWDFQQLQKLLANHSGPEISLTTRQLYEQIRMNRYIIRRERHILSEYFYKQRMN
ncbi:hypothetical protein GJ496_005150 [Pomphorhynchus laevis]|nr:hypothetical protein GJ496_005150 [Pomphorhynchus laevis]